MPLVTILKDSGSPEVELVMTAVVRGVMGPQRKRSRVLGTARGTETILMGHKGLEWDHENIPLGLGEHSHEFRGNLTWNISGPPG